VELLIYHGAYVDEYESHTDDTFQDFIDTAKIRTALHLAAETGYLAIVEKLVENDANVNALSQLFRELHVNKVTPLHFAAAAGHNCVVKYLIPNGANVNTTGHLFTAHLNVAIMLQCWMS